MEKLQLASNNQHLQLASATSICNYHLQLASATSICNQHLQLASATAEGLASALYKLDDNACYGTSSPLTLCFQRQPIYLHPDYSEGIFLRNIQGCGLGTSEFIVNASELNHEAVHERNRIVKFTDDTYLIVALSMKNTISENLETIKVYGLRITTSD